LRAGLVRPPSLTRLVGLVPSLVSHPGPQQHQGRLHPAVPPFFFFWGAPWARLPFPPARYLRPHAEERRVQRWITKIWNPVTGALVTSLRLANIFQTRFTGRLSLCRVWAGGCKC
jgi:hypothetical protein